MRPFFYVSELMSVSIYLDESGDLGWTFDKPYRFGGSSRYLTIASLLVPDSKKHHPERVIRDLYNSRNWSTAKEKKWSDMSESARKEFVKLAIKLLDAHADITYHVIVVKKEKVNVTFRNDANLLYNYMIHCSLIKKMKMYPKVTLIPDPRSIKVQSGNSLHDYLQLDLWYREGVTTVLETKPTDSKKTLGLQFSDMLAGLAQAAYEDSNTACWDLIKTRINVKTLFIN